MTLKKNIKAEKAMLHLSNLHVQVGTKSLLNLDNLELKAGEVMGVLGPNGAGKSTLFKAITGTIENEGRVLLHGKPRQDWQHKALAQHLGVLAQSSELTFPFLAQEVVALGLTPLTIGHKEGWQLIYNLMEHTDCRHLAERSYPSLSGGERQRVQLARVLLQLSQAQSAPLLMLDEPTSAQDLGQQHGILSLARDLAKNRGYAVLVILHDLNQALQYCDHCCLIDNGEIALQGEPETILTPETIERHWQYLPEKIHMSSGQPILI
ncbi:heme ABC transporter ATP-binding protein [Oceanospirillum linum]|nr:heme ABC transporter ATP-binding protein [Oceanospirillum linum]SEF80813.1 iron complex transport system ATP-binding protein [Oleiphilus messinensis]SMP18925.1 iron complex transport system ATP-binding protein [Oceanospirillum linum]